MESMGKAIRIITISGSVLFILGITYEQVWKSLFLRSEYKLEFLCRWSSVLACGPEGRIFDV